MGTVRPRTGAVEIEPKKSYQKTNFADILVNLSVKDKSSVTRRIRLVGVACPILEYTDKKYTEERGKTIRVPFPDAETNRSFTRVGHPDPSQCAWAKMGYVPVTQYVQNVLEKQENGEWTVKLLKKGRSIFSEFAKWEKGRREDDGLDEDDAIYSGVRNSHCFRVVATATGMAAPLSVEYGVFPDSKPTPLTDEMIELLRKAGEPSPEELAEIKAQYVQDRKTYKNMPPWEDYFAYGYSIDKIFKYNPPKDMVDAEDEFVMAEPKMKYDDEDITPDLPVSSKSVKKSSKPVFEDENDDDDDEIPFI